MSLKLLFSALLGKPRRAKPGQSILTVQGSDRGRRRQRARVHWKLEMPLGLQVGSGGLKELFVPPLPCQGVAIPWTLSGLIPRTE